MQAKAIEQTYTETVTYTDATPFYLLLIVALLGIFWPSNDTTTVKAQQYIQAGAHHE